MSYIRALSNPERLYIVGNTTGQVEIYDNANDNRTLAMPRHVFHGLMQRWHESQSDTRFRGASLIEDPIDWKWVLSYKTWNGKTVRAFKVTWFYVAADVVGRR